MSRSLTLIRLAAVLPAGLVLAGSGGLGTVALAQERPNPGVPREANPPAQSRSEGLRELARPGLRWGVLSENDLVAPEEREALGLEDTGWTRQHGKVHPDVYKSLDRAEQVTEPWLDITGHTGTVYVQVQLKYEQRAKADSGENKALVRQLQGKVLAQLTAAELYVEYPFQTLPALLGYASRAAVEKLEKNPDVLAVCLDEKPLPRRPPRVASEDLPATTPSDGTPPGSDSKVQPDVSRAVALKERVFVIVRLNESRLEAGLQPQAGAARNVEERLLSSLSADQFWLVRRTAVGSTNAPLLKGFVNSSGLGTLQSHPLVDSVVLDERLHLDLEPVKRRP